MILTAGHETNSLAFAKILQLYVPKRSCIADVTYGRGVFWQDVEIPGEYNYSISQTDIVTGVDFTMLPYADKSFDALVLDPPYMHGGETVKESINKCYRNQNGSHASVIRLYARGILEAHRVLRKDGTLIIKTQDEIESGKQRWSHMELITLCELVGFRMVDLFVVTPGTIPAMREKYQKSARKNHSYFLVGKKP